MFEDFVRQCAPDVHVETMMKLITVESSFDPWAIGVVGGRLERRPRSQEEAIATAKWLKRNGYNFSVGYAQVNQSNFARYGLTIDSAFDGCRNLRAGAEILKECFARARRTQDEQPALRAAFSCYYSGNFVTGFKHGYVQKVVKAGQIRVSKAHKANVAVRIQQPSDASSEELSTQGQRASTSALLF